MSDDVVASARLLRDRLATAVEQKHRSELNQAALLQQLSVAAATSAEQLASKTARLERAHVDTLAHVLRVVVELERQHADLHAALIEQQQQQQAQAASLLSQSQHQQHALSHSARTRSSKSVRKSSTASTNLETMLQAVVGPTANTTTTTTTASSSVSNNAAPPPIPPIDEAPSLPQPLAGSPLQPAVFNAPPLPQTPRV